MKIRIFQSDKGDCLLLESADGKYVLCDGGMPTSMRYVVSKELAKLRTKGIKLEHVYVSHIDQDHIAGVLILLEDELEWRLYDHHNTKGTPKSRPKVPRPPEIGGIWHNAFRDQVGENADRVEDLLAASATTLLASGVRALTDLGLEYQQIALSITEALKVSRLAQADLLRIPINVIPGATGPAKLLMMRKNQVPFQVGSMSFTIVGPSNKELEELKRGWNNWLASDEGRSKVADLRKVIKAKLEDFGNVATFDQDWYGEPSYKGVTPPNVASLMFMVEENGKRLLLTGDSQQDMILAGLDKAGLMTNGCIHVDVLKVQHHGSEHNMDPDFARRVSADHYIFCGNGKNGNPERSVIDYVYNSRMGKASELALDARAAGRNFKFWFSTTSDAQKPGSTERKTFAACEAHVADLVQRSNGRLNAAFNKTHSISFKV